MNIKNEIEKAMKTFEISKKEGICSSIADKFGFSFIRPFIAKKFETLTDVGILYSIPYLAQAISPIIFFLALIKSKARKTLILSSFALEAISWFFLSALILINPPIEILFIFSTIAITLYYFSSEGSYSMWQSLISDLSKFYKGNFAVYLAERSRMISMFSLLFLLSAGALLNSMQNLGFEIAFASAFFIAGIGKSLSFFYLLKHYFPEYKKQKYTALKRALAHRSLFLFILLFFLAVNISSPFFSAYMIRSLGFSMFDYTMVIAAGVLSSAFFYTKWGNLMKNYNAYVLLVASAVGTTAVPIFWSFASSFPQGLLIEAFASMFWAGFDISLSIIVMHELRGLTSYINPFYRTCAIVGSMLGTGISTMLIASLFAGQIEEAVYINIFAISALARLLVAFLGIFLFFKAKNVKIYNVVGSIKKITWFGIASPYILAGSLFNNVASIMNGKFKKIKKNK